MFESLVTFPRDAFAGFDRLQEQIEQTVGTMGLPSSIRAMSRGAFPPINIGNSNDAVDIYALAPGIDPKSIDVQIDKGLLSIAGERKGEVPESGADANVYARERFVGKFKRVIALPEDADPARVDASYRNGVMHITVQRREASKPRRIAIT